MVCFTTATVSASVGTILKVTASDGSIGTAWAAHCDGNITYWVTAAHVVGDSKTVTIGKLQPRSANVLETYASDDIAILESVRLDVDDAPVIAEASIGST